MRSAIGIVFLCAAVRAFPQTAVPPLQIQGPAKIDESRTCENGSCTIKAVQLLVSGPHRAGTLRISVTGFDNNSSKKTPQTLSVEPETVELGDSGVAAVSLQISMKAALAVPFTGVLAVSSAGGATATIPLTVRDPAASSVQAGPSAQDLVQTLMETAACCGFGYVFAIALLLGFLIGSPTYLLIRMGRASWDISSWASSATIAATLATTLLGIPGGLGLTKFAWRYEYSVVSALALLLTTASPVIFNLTRHYSGKPPSAAISVNFVFAFLISAMGTITATAASWLTLWYANADLVQAKTISSDVGFSIQVGLGVLAFSLAMYFGVSIVQTVRVQSELAKAAVPIQTVKQDVLDALPVEQQALVDAARVALEKNPALAKPWSVL